MQISREQLTPTKIKLTVTADQELLDGVKAEVVLLMGRNVRIQGFRAGKAPKHLIEKQLDQAALQTEFMEQAVNRAYVGALQSEKIRPTAQPQIAISKFVPFDTLEFTAEFDAIGAMKIADYKKLKLARKSVKVSQDQIDAVMADLKGRVADKVDVDRAVKSGDQATIDFVGVDAKTKEPINGADGKDYPLLVGSNSFIPGFEDNVIGVKPGADKEFEITFPADYSVQTLQKRKVIFTVTVKSVQAIKEPKLDDAFAAKVGPFKTMAELKADIKSQLTSEAEEQSRRNFENELIETLAKQSEVAIPDGLINDEIDRMEAEEKRNLVYRGQTWQEHLDADGETEETHREKNRDPATMRVKAGLVLGEIAENEGIDVSPEELKIRIQQLKAQYKDVTMLAELDKEDNIRDVASRIVSEKTIAKLTEYVTANK
jgi:trigger factor